MQGIKNAIKIILLGFVPLMLLVYLIRLSNNKISDFIGLSDLYYYFQNVNIWQPFQDMYNNLDWQYQQFILVNQSFQNVEDLWQFLALIPQWLGGFFSMMSFPIQMIYYIFSFIINIFIEIFRFISFLGGFSQ